MGPVRRMGTALVLLVLGAMGGSGCALFSTDQPAYLHADEGHMRIDGGPVTFEITGKGIEYRRGIIKDDEASATFEGKASQGKRSEYIYEAEDTGKPAEEPKPTPVE